MCAKNGLTNVKTPSGNGPDDGHGIAWPSAKSVYTLRACVALAAAEPGTSMKMREIAQAATVPEGFLSKILGELRAAGIVSAQRGYYGGYRLTRPSGEIHVDELLHAVGTRELFASLPHRSEGPMPFIDDLRTRLQSIASDTLRSVSLAELASGYGAS